MAPTQHLVGPPVAAFDLKRAQAVIYAMSSATGNNPFTNAMGTLELRVPGSLVFRKFHLAIVPKAWRPTVNTQFTVQVDFLANNQPVSRLEFNYGWDPTIAWPTNALVPLSNAQMAFLPPFVCLRQTNYNQYAELVDPIDMTRLQTGAACLEADHLQWALHDAVNAQDGATLIITSPMKLVSDCDLIRVQIVPASMPFQNQTDNYTDGGRGANFMVCMACMSNSINPG